MTLHEAMVEVLREHSGWMYRDELARSIAERDLYRQRSDGPAPSDQLRLRARRYSQLFEGSDAAYTRIRLRQGTPAIRERRSVRPKETRSSAKPSTSLTSDQVSARRRRSQAALKYKPATVDVLLIAEAPPNALDRYFYFEDVREQDSLFRYVVRGVLGVEPSREEKAKLLAASRDAGVFLIDVSVDPLSGTPLAGFVPDLTVRAQRAEPKKVVLIKATVYDAAYCSLRAAGLPVVNRRVPFPGSGQQKRFATAFAAALAGPVQ